MGGEEGQDSRDGTPGVQSDGVVQTEDESVEALIMGEVKRRSMEVRWRGMRADVY